MRVRPHGWPAWSELTKEMFTLLDLCVSSLRRGHANLFCIVPILTDDPRREPVRHRQATIAKCIARPLQIAKYTWPGSNWRPSACEADVIATRPQVLRNPGGGRGASVNASHPAWTHPQTRTWNPIRRIQRLHHCSLQFRLEWEPAAKANRNKSHNCTCMRVGVAAVHHMALWLNG